MSLQWPKEYLPISTDINFKHSVNDRISSTGQ